MAWDPVAEQLARKLVEFEEALAEEPRTVSRDRAAHLEMLAVLPPIRLAATRSAAQGSALARPRL